MENPTRMGNWFTKLFPTRVSRKQATDTGMAMALICMLIGLIGEKTLFFKVALVVLVVDMAVPAVFKPVATLWLGLSGLLGTVVSRLLLTIVFAVVLTPIGLIRKLMGIDPLKRKRWKRDTSTVFKTRDDVFDADSMKFPF
jgi:hypothetical protein